MLGFRLVLAGLALSGLLIAGCSGANDGGGEVPGTRISQAALKGGCRVVCPKCHPGEACPMYACRLSCPPGVTTCGDKLCRHGDYCCNASCGTCAAPGTMCSMIACAPSTTCVETAMCMVGYEWSTTACQCVPSTTTTAQ